MRSLVIRSSLVVAWCFVVLLLASHSDAAKPGKPSQPRRAAAVDENAESDAAPAAEEEGAQPQTDEPAPDTEPDAGNGSAADESSDKEDDELDDEAPKKPDAEGNDDASDSQSDPARQDGAESTTSETDEPLAPPPPGGGLLEKIKRAETPVDRPQPAAFHGIRAGRSTVDELEKAWGAPLSVTRQKEVVRRTYRLDASGRVEVLCLHNIVQGVVAHYDQHPRWSELAAELGLEKIEPVDVVDEFGAVVGAAFPEGGALVVFRPGGSRRVAEIVYEPIDPQAFSLRAEHRLGKDYSACQKDLDMALVVDPQCARAYWLRARALRATGQIDAATKAADEAARLEPKNAQYQLTASALAADAGQLVKAIEQTKKAIGLCAAQPELKACALNQLGDQMAVGPGRDYKQALPLHMQAIKLAEPLAHDRRILVQKTARDALIAAHLSAARNIAWGNWKMKKKMVPAWLNRAEELADESSADADGLLDMRLRVCREALMACVGTEGDLDPTPWIEKALTLATPAIAAAADPLRRRELQWEIGAALYDALQVYHTIGDTHQAMKYGTLAVENLEAGAESRQLEPVEAYLLGRLYYRMGAVYAVHVKDPEKAVAWFERAVPLLERPVPAAAMADTGRHGESFVSMGVAYWATGNHDEALRLTSQGMKLMQQAVKDGTLAESALQVPYTNLATMHRYLGDDEQADAFGDMAAKATESRRQ